MEYRVDREKVMAVNVRSHVPKQCERCGEMAPYESDTCLHCFEYLEITDPDPFVDRRQHARWYTPTPGRPSAVMQPSKDAIAAWGP